MEVRMKKSEVIDKIIEYHPTLPDFDSWEVII